MADLRDFHGPNAGYVLGQFERYTDDPASVGEQWRTYFQTNGPPPTSSPTSNGVAGAVAATDVAAVVGAHELAEAVRARGHTAAHLSPISEPRRQDPALQPEPHGLSGAALRQLSAAIVGGPLAADAAHAEEAIQRLRSVYAGSIGYEFEHLPNTEERTWFRDAVESGRFRTAPDAERQRAVLRRLSEVEGFERYLHKAFVGQKRFSVEGNDMLILMLDELIARAGAGNAREVVIGMAHRGRLNVLVHVLGKPYAQILRGFQGAPAGSEPVSGLKGTETSGDVKYHMGWRESSPDGALAVVLSPNPSHLEFVNPVVVGMARAAQDDTAGAGKPTLEPSAALPVAIHGDAAFPGQGVVAETLNMSGLPGYTVGGTIHIIVNNQIGFTTLPEDDRSTRYSSDPAKGYEIPILHVNSDDVEACLSVTALAHAYRERFHKDVLIDLVGYRRWGHNEGDEPAFTQPRMYEVIREHPTVRERWADRLVADGVASREDADAELQAVLDRLDQIKDSLGEEAENTVGEEARVDTPRAHRLQPVAAEALTAWNKALLAWPEGFVPNARLARLLERRRDALTSGGIDWGHAETLAFASLLADGVPVRLTGQDAERGTFSHRHLVLHDAATGAKLTPLAQLPDARASFEVHNSPLSEMAVVGFEFGYSVADPQVLVVWEAQFGDFANGAQVIIDQFLAASQQKWGQTCGLTLLLPHGYEGQGPEHSSARLERFLQLAAEDNLQVVNCTTSAQYFHLLRRQAARLTADPRPLVVMSPKSLLRHPAAASRLEDLVEGEFQPVLFDAEAAARADQVTRLLLCSGKVYVDLIASEEREQAAHVALARVEQLYPLPQTELEALLHHLPKLEEVFWVQEEPKNMGAWTYLAPRLRALAGGTVPVRYVGRPERASPAEGSAAKHAAHQARIVHEAWVGNSNV